MSFLVRKINRAKWQNKIDGDVQADAITNCLKTSQNKLSLWHIETEAEIDKAVLAIVANQEHLDSIDVVTLEEASLKKDSLKIVESDGKTPVKSLIHTHRDIIELNFTKLGKVKDLILEKVNNSKSKRYTILQLKTILDGAIQNGLIEKDDLKGNLKE